MIKGITKRWMLNTLSVILAIIVLLIVILIFAASNIINTQIEQDLFSASNELSMVFPGYQTESSTTFTTGARDYIENFDKKEQMGVMVLNSINDITFIHVADHLYRLEAFRTLLHSVQGLILVNECALKDIAFDIAALSVASRSVVRSEISCVYRKLRAVRISFDGRSAGARRFDVYHICHLVHCA